MSGIQKLIVTFLLAFVCCLGFTYQTHAQFGFGGGPPEGGPPGGGPDSPDQMIVKDFDKDNDGRLSTSERKKARASLKNNNNGRGPRRGPPGGGRGGARPTGKAGPAVKLTDVETYPSSKLYDTDILRTLFLEFPQNDWEKELADFKPTDVEVPATLTVDGKEYPNVGVSFRGASSFFSIAEGSKRSLNLSMDYQNDDQKLYGYKSLNLLNCNGDPTLMSSLLYSQIAGQKIATPKVNFVNVVINGRSWGVYANAQQFNKDFLLENFKTKKGARWKVSGNPRGDAGLRYLGEKVEPYKTRFEIKSKDKEQAWRDLINLCKVLNKTPTDKLEEALKPILDIEGTLWFLAVDVALINSDGYWTRASDYSLYQDPKGIFHVIPHDMNEAFREAHGGGGPGGGRPGGPGGGPRGRGGFRGGPGGGGPPQGRPPHGGGQEEPGAQRGRRERGGRPNRGGGGAGEGYKLDPLVGITEDRFPLRSKLLAVPKFKEQYLRNMRTIASDMISWEHLGPQVESAKQLIESSVRADTRKLMTNDAFESATSSKSPAKSGSLREFAEKRSKYLLEHPEIKKLAEE